MIEGARELLIVPSPVIVELDRLVNSRLGLHPFDVFLADVEDGAVVIEGLVPPDYSRVRTLLREYSDLPLGFVDASVLAVVERLEERKLATLDCRHSGVVRPGHVEALELLPSSQPAG